MTCEGAVDGATMVGAMTGRATIAGGVGDRTAVTGAVMAGVAATADSGGLHTVLLCRFRDLEVRSNSARASTARRPVDRCARNSHAPVSGFRQGDEVYRW